MQKKKTQAQLDKVADAVRKQKRQDKIKRLSTTSQWQGLENYQPITEDVSSNFLNKFRMKYRSGKMMRFKDWLAELEELLSELD